MRQATFDNVAFCLQKSVQHSSCRGGLTIVELKAMDNKSLVEKTLAGNRKAFETLIERHQRLVSHFVFRLIDNPEDREDVCQDVFLKVYENLGGFKFESKLSTWIAKIAYNTCLNHLAKKKLPLFDDLTSDERSLDAVPGNVPGPHELAQGKELGMLLRSEIDKLPVHYRTVLTLYHLDQMSYSEIGEIMSLPEGTVKSHLFRARKLLKARLIVKYQPEDLCNSSI
jgi:RNA polymerase sigma factor (sigma-70 family)